MMTDTIEAVARAMADSLALDWDGKANGTEYANHGYWLPLSQAAITAHTKALIEGAGEVEKRLNDHAHMIQRDGLAAMLDTASQAAATIAAQKAEIERLTEREAQAKLDGVRAGIEASVLWLSEHRGDVFANRMRRALDAEAIARGEG